MNDLRLIMVMIIYFDNKNYWKAIFVCNEHWDDDDYDGETTGALNKIEKMCVYENTIQMRPVCPPSIYHWHIHTHKKKS